jgi:TRAP-type C4-dicarboxylate transport system permease small subunit
MIKKLDRFVGGVAFYGIVIAVVLMLSLTILNIVLRWFNTSIEWVDPMVRHLVFLSAFLGGTLATGEDNHIRIDLAAKILETKKLNKTKVWLERVVILITCIATILLAKAGLDFAKIELEFGKDVFLGIHSGYLVGIIPFGMGLLSLRFILRLLMTFSRKEEGEHV